MNKSRTIYGEVLATALTVLSITFFPTRSAFGTCPGDCNGDNTTTVEEIIAAVNVALGIDSPARCRAADTDGNRLVSIDEILQAVIAVLEGCPAVRPSPTRTLVPATATPSPFEESVCGGAVASIPRLCALDVRPVYTIGSTVYGVLRVCLSDLEGDLEGFCLGLSINGEPPEVLCDFFDPPFPAGQTLNTCLETDPFALGFRGVNATWVIGLNVVDRMGQTSNTVVTTFFCCR